MLFIKLKAKPCSNAWAELVLILFWINMFLSRKLVLDEWNAAGCLEKSMKTLNFVHIVCMRGRHGILQTLTLKWQ